MPTRSSHCWKRCFQSMASLKSFALTTAHSMRVSSLPTSVHLGASHMRPQVCTTCSPMDLPRHVSCVKSAKHALQWAKYSGADPHLALLALQATPIDSKLPSPAELLYQCRLKTTIPAKIHNSDPSAMQVCEQNDACSKAVKSQADKCSKTLAPLYAGQPVATYDTLWQIWVPATVICILPWSSYLVCTSSGSTYCRMWRHLCEYSVKAADTVPSGTTATPQALSSHHFLAAHPASPTPALCMHPTSAAPATLATQMKQAPAVPAMPAVQKNALAPKSVTSHATPVQPRRSGHAHMAPRCLIQEI